jgi:hypothetical protein
LCSEPAGPPPPAPRWLHESFLVPGNGFERHHTNHVKALTSYWDVTGSHHIVSVSSGAVEVWDAASGERIGVLQGVTEEAGSDLASTVTFLSMAGEPRIATLTLRAVVTIYDGTTLAPLHTFAAPEPSPESHHTPRLHPYVDRTGRPHLCLAYHGRDRLIILDGESGEAVRTLAEQPVPVKALTGCATSNGPRIVVGTIQARANLHPLTI